MKIHAQRNGARAMKPLSVAILALAAMLSGAPAHAVSGGAEVVYLVGKGERRDYDQKADLKRFPVPSHQRDHRSPSSGARRRSRASGAPLSSGTTRRATVMNPVCATMRWKGRTDWPSMFHGR